DFTVNAIAYNPYDGFIDLYDGMNDIKNKVIKAVGNADERFKEDALRILRALRFASGLGFTIDKYTSLSIHSNKKLLQNIAVERIWVEFCKLLMGKNAVMILREYVDVIAVFMPEIVSMVGFDQHNPHHCYDVWEHTLHALSFAENDLVIRLAVLFHDCGKPYTFTMDNNNIGHFYAHAQKSCEIAGQIFGRLKTDNYTKNAVLTLIKHHDRIIEPTEKSVKKAVRKLGNAEMFEKLLKVKNCDVQAQVEYLVKSRLQILQQIAGIYARSKEENSFIFSAKNLAINGNDIMALGVKQGKEIGCILNILLESVLDGKIENNHDILIKKVSEIISN
ncbi:MAG: CCA tRNA nucleotidyltransferase, partial [Clostridia bacterium]|nr:CCA tRNA nucleotidyltransferase [Clostridia bacterium]